jgi:hypothetical protein
MKNLTGEVNCELECLVEKYTNMGGDVLRDYYKAKADKAYTIAREYHDNYMSDEFNLSFDINITANASDLGVVNTFLEYFDPKREYHSGECTIYNDRSYMCVEDFDSMKSICLVVIQNVINLVISVLIKKDILVNGIMMILI